MASSQVVGRHEVFEYSYRVGPKEARKRIKLVVIQRREQRRKSLIAAGRIFEHAPVRLRLNLHRAKYGDPEVVSGSREVPITLRRKVKPAPNTIIVHRKVAQPQPTVVVQQVKQKSTPSPKGNIIMIQPAPPVAAPEPRRIELVDQPVGPGDLIQQPPEVIVIPPTQTPSPATVIIDRPSSRASSVGSVTRPKVKRSNSLTNSFRRFPSIMGLIRRNSRDRRSGGTVVSEDEHINEEYVDIDPRASYEDIIIEERESQLGSPIAPSARHGPPSVAESYRPPTIPGSVASGRSGRSSRSRAMSFGSPKNRLIKAPPHQVPLPESHSPSSGTYPVHARESAEYEPARSVTSHHTADRSYRGPPSTAHGPTYTETYLHDSPTSHTRSLHDHEGSIISRSHHDAASVKTDNRSVPDLAMHSPSRHSQSAHSHAPSARSVRTRHSAEGSTREGRELVLHEGHGARSPSLREGSIRDGHLIRDGHSVLDGHSVRDGQSVRDGHSIRDGYSVRDGSVRDSSVRDGYSIRDGQLVRDDYSFRDGYSVRDGQSVRDGHSIRDGHSPSIQEPSVRGDVRSPSLGEPSIRDGHSIRDARSTHGGESVRGESVRGDGGLYSPTASFRERLSDVDRENDRIQYFDRSPAQSRVGSPSIRAPSSRVASPPLHYGGSPSIHAPESYREGSPSLHAPSVRAPSQRVDSPSLHGGMSEYAHSRKGSPSIQGNSPPASVVAGSVRSGYPASSANGRVIRPKSPLSQSGTSYASSKRSKASKGPEITPVPMPPPSVVSHRSGVSRNGAKSPLSRVASSVASEEPSQIIIPPTAPSVAGSHRSGRASSEGAHKMPLPASTYSPSVISQAPTSRSGVPVGPTISRVPSSAGHRSRAPSVVPSTAYRTPLPASTYAPSEASEAPTRAPSVAPSTARRMPLPPSTYAPTVMSDDAESTIAPPSRIGSVAPSTAYRTPLPPSTYAPSEAPTRTPSNTAYRMPLPPSTYAPTVMSDDAESTIAPPSRMGSVAPSVVHRTPLPPSTYAPSEAPSRAPSVAPSMVYRTPLPPSTYAPSEAPTRATSKAHRTPLPPSTYAPTVMSDDAESTIAPPSRIGSVAPSTAYRTPLPPSTYAPSEAPTRATSKAHKTPLPPSTYAPTVMSDDAESTIAPPSRIGSVAPSTAYRTPLPASTYAPSEAPTRATSRAHRTPLPPSTYAPTVMSDDAQSTIAPPSRIGSVAPSTAHRTPLPPSTYAPSEAPTRAPSVAPSVAYSSAYRAPLPPSTYAPSEAPSRARSPSIIPDTPYRAAIPPSTYASSIMSDEPGSTAVPPSRAGSVAPSVSYRTGLPPSTYAPSEAPTRAPSVAPSTSHRTPLPPSTYAPSEAPSRAPSSAAHRTPLPASTYAPTVISDRTRARSPSISQSTAYRTPLPASTYSPSVISQAPTARAPSVAPSSAAHHTPLPPSTYAPSVISETPTRVPSSAAHRMPLPPSTYAPSVVSHTPTSRSRRTQSAAGVALPESVVGSPVSRPPSAANTHRTGSLRRTPSALGTPRVPPSVIGSQRVPPSIAGSGPSRHTPPPESAPSDIAPESESHGGKALRAQARLEGDKMSMAFTASRQAHDEGDKARAKQLSDLGREHQEKMHKLHDEAANQVFKEKNDGRPADEVDLHGLYVKEALSRLSRYLREAPVAGQTTVRVITGKGIHSEGEPQLIPAVEESLRSKGLRHHTDPNNAGVVVVELGPRSPVSD